MSHCNLVRKPIPMPQAMTIPDAKAAVDKEWNKLTNFPAWQDSKVKSRQEVIEQAQQEGKTGHVCNAFGLMPPQHLWFGNEIPKMQKQCCTTRRRCERRLRPVCCVHKAGIFHVTHESCRSSGRKIQTSRMRRTSERRSISLHPSKNGGRSKVIENSGIGMSDHLMDSSFSVQISEIAGQNSRPTIWKSLGRKIDVKNFHDENTYSCSAKKDYFFLYMWTTSEWE